MFKKKRETSKGLKILLVISFVLLALFIAFFVLFAINAGSANDADLKDFGAVMQYHLDGLMDLFVFKFHDASNAFYFALSGLFYGLVAIWVIFLIVGILLAVKKKRKVMVFGIILTLLAVAIYMIGATGSAKYWAIINAKDPFKDALVLRIYTFGLVIAGALYAILAYISYFACVVEAFKNPKVEQKEEKAEEQSVFEEEPTQEEVAPNNNEEEVVMFEQIEAEPEAVQEQPQPESHPAFEEEPEPIFEEEPAPIAEEAPIREAVKQQIYEEKKPEEKGFDKNELAELIRSIVRDEISRNAPSVQNPGNGPLVVQYFGTMPIQQEVVQPKPEAKPEPQPEPKPEPEPQPQPEPVKEEKKEPVAKVSEEEEIKVHDKIVPEKPKAHKYNIVTDEKKEEPAPVPAPVVEEAKEEKNKIIRIPFQERMLNADDEMKRNYNELKNEILSYGVNSRVSNSGDAFRLHRKTYVKITIAGLSLKLYFALNPDDYKDSTIPVQNAGHKGIYEEIPLVFKVKSGLSMRRAKELIQTVMEQGGLEQGTIGDTDWVEKLKEQPEASDEDKED